MELDQARSVARALVALTKEMMAHWPESGRDRKWVWETFAYFLRRARAAMLPLPKGRPRSQPAEATSEGDGAPHQVTP